MNSFITFRHKNRDLPVGVSWCESEGKYKVYCSMLNGKNKTLGRFSDVSKAHETYCKFKEKMAKTLAEKFEGQVDRRVTEALHNFKVSSYTGGNND